MCLSFAARSEPSLDRGNPTLMSYRIYRSLNNMSNKTAEQRVFADLEGVYAMGKTLQTMADGNYHVQVGIFGDKNARDSNADSSAYSKSKPNYKKIKSAGAAEMTNAELGFIHEMGSKKRGIPRRSFLWDTLRDRGSVLMELLKAPMAALFIPGTAEIMSGGAAAVAGEGKVLMFLKRAGLAAEGLVQEAFRSGGFGKWPAVKNMTRKATKLILVETTQLRRAITSRVRKS